MFKNIIAYRFNKPFSIEDSELESSMSDFKFTACGSQDISKFGFTNAMGKYGETLVHSAEGYQMIAVTKEEKIIPSKSVREVVDAKIAAIEVAEGRKLAKKEKDSIKDEVIQEMLPRAFTKKAITRAIIMLDMQLILVDSSSSSNAENLLALLRKALGSLPVVPVSYNKTIESEMTGWVRHGIAAFPFEMLDEAELRCEETGIAKFKKQDLRDDEVIAHIESGKKVHKISLRYGQSLAFTQCSDGAIKRIKLAEEFSAQNDDAEDMDAKLDADFILFAKECEMLMCDLASAFGGMVKISDSAKI